MMLLDGVRQSHTFKEQVIQTFSHRILVQVLVQGAKASLEELSAERAHMCSSYTASLCSLHCYFAHLNASFVMVHKTKLLGH